MLTVNTFGSNRNSVSDFLLNNFIHQTSGRNSIQ